MTIDNWVLGVKPLILLGLPSKHSCFYYGRLLRLDIRGSILDFRYIGTFVKLKIKNNLLTKIFYRFPISGKKKIESQFQHSGDLT